MFSDPGGKRTYGATNLLFATGAGQEVYNISGGTRAKMFNRVCTFSDSRCKLFSCTSSSCIELTHCTFLTWVIPNQVVKERCSNGWIINIGSNLTPQRGSASIDYLSSFW